MAKKKSEFNFVVGFYWNNVNGSVGAYAMGSEVHFGTLEAAKQFQKYCQTRADNKGKDARTYKIFQLVEVPQ